jgi:hypothetical protein
VYTYSQHVSASSNAGAQCASVSFCLYISYNLFERLIVRPICRPSLQLDTITLVHKGNVVAEGSEE